MANLICKNFLHDDGGHFMEEMEIDIQLCLETWYKQ